MWLDGSINSTRTISGNLSKPNALFVTTTGDIFVDNGDSNGRVDKWTSDGNISVPAMYVNSSCLSLFIDINDTLYCSMYYKHQVVTTWLNGNTNTLTIVAGNGSSGNTSNMLWCPNGIFVDINFDLYVADSFNNRIQLFKLGEVNGTTVTLNGPSGNITLNYPTGVVLDADHYLFIVDYGNDRIIGSGPNGFLCVVGCTSSWGSASSQLNGPCSLSFDNDGNMFVTDLSNSRIQKFLVLTNSCGKCDSRL